MALLQTTVTLTANQNSRDILSALLGYPYVASRNQVVRIAINSDTSPSGVLFGVQVGANNYVDQSAPSEQDRFPINPDDFVIPPIGMTVGSQLLIPVQETLAGTPKLYISILDQPV